MNRTIYAYIGVIGSGKDYASKAKSEELSAKIFDFSDGVRDITFGFLGYTPKCNDDYVLFKMNENKLMFPIKEGLFKQPAFSVCNLTGRKFLENVGITMRNYDKDFWAKYTINKCREFLYNEIKENRLVNFLIFNAVRYKNEAQFLIDLADEFGYDLQFIFTNYKSDRYEIRNDDSEKFAQYFLNEGFDHMDNITEEVYPYVTGKFLEGGD